MGFIRRSLRKSNAQLTPTQPTLNFPFVCLFDYHLQWDYIVLFYDYHIFHIFHHFQRLLCRFSLACCRQIELLVCFQHQLARNPFFWLTCWFGQPVRLIIELMIRSHWQPTHNSINNSKTTTTIITLNLTQQQTASHHQLTSDKNRNARLLDFGICMHVSRVIYAAAVAFPRRAP